MCTNVFGAPTRRGSWMVPRRIASVHTFRHGSARCDCGCVNRMLPLAELSAADRMRLYDQDHLLSGQSEP